MEDTQKNIEEMLRDAEALREPSDLLKQPVVHKGDENVPMPMVISTIEGGSFIPLYDTITGERSRVPYNMLRQLLRRKRKDGSLVFTTAKPSISPKVGSLKCMLHPEAPNRNHYDELGLPVCRKSNLTSPYMVRRHMEKRHPSAWATIEEERKAKEKIEERDFQRSLLTGVKAPQVSNLKKQGRPTKINK